MYAKKTITMIIIALILATLMISGCSKTHWITQETSDKQAGIMMKYKMPENEKLKYKQTTNFNQTMDVRGSSIVTTFDNACDYSIVPKGISTGDFMLGVTIDDMSVKINSIKGDIIPDLTGVIGQSFDMSISDFGYESNLIGADEIKYEMAPGSEQSISSTFQNAFPDLAQKLLRVGDSWVTVDTVNETTSKGTLVLIFENTNTLVGFEEMNGFGCAKISTSVKGTLEGKSTEAGMTFVSDGTIEATDTWHFAPKDGVLVKAVSEGVGTGVTKVVGQEEIVIPMTREFSMSTELIN